MKVYTVIEICNNTIASFRSYRSKDDAMYMFMAIVNNHTKILGIEDQSERAIFDGILTIQGYSASIEETDVE